MSPPAALLESMAPLVSTQGLHKGVDRIEEIKRAHQHRLDPNYTIIEKPIGTRRPIRVVCLGAGYSGLMMGIVFNERMKETNADFVIYERNADLGGTWYENRYPGCQCDIPAHNYAYSFAANSQWPNYYATSEQIHAYMKDVAKQYEVEKYIRLQHSVESAVWNEEKGKWDLKIRSGSTVFNDECDIFINASGVLNNWKWPTIEGLESYRGKLIHSAHWDSSYDFTGKRVACIGIGSSGIQIVPKLAEVVGNMDCYVRSQTWISPAPGINEPTANDPEMDGNYNFADSTLELFKDPEVLRDYRVAIMNRRAENYNRVIADCDLQKEAQELFRKSMIGRLGDSEKGKRAAELLVPSFPVGCRRQTPGPGFLEALIQDNIELRWNDISKITERGILTRSGAEFEYDVIVCATGFDTSFKPSFPLVGRNGVNMAEKWEKDVPKAYMGMCVPEFPNYFCFVGPNSPLANGSLILGIQATAAYIYKWMDKIQTEGIRSFEIDNDVNEEYNQHIQKYLERTVWTGNCRSWYKRGTIDGPVIAIYGGSIFHLLEVMKNPRWEDFKMDRTHEAKTNRFAYLGNGMTLRETKGGSIGATQTLDFNEFWNLFVLPQDHIPPWRKFLLPSPNRAHVLHINMISMTFQVYTK